MTDAVDSDLYRRTKALLEPGEIVLNGAIVHTNFAGDDELQMNDAVVEVGEIIADHAAPETNTYVYSGVDDPEFASNQHQGLTIDGDEFVWECQTLLRDGTFDVVFYYEADTDQEVLVEAIRDAGYEVTGVESDKSDEGAGERTTSPEDQT
jgi:hypothetical protein